MISAPHAALLLRYALATRTRRACMLRCCAQRARGLSPGWEHLRGCSPSTAAACTACHAPRPPAPRPGPTDPQHASHLCLAVHERRRCLQELCIRLHRLHARQVRLCIQVARHVWVEGAGVKHPSLPNPPQRARERANTCRAKHPLQGAGGRRHAAVARRDARKPALPLTPPMTCPLPASTAAISLSSLAAFAVSMMPACMVMESGMWNVANARPPPAFERCCHVKVHRRQGATLDLWAQV